MQTLKPGSAGPDVRALQAALNDRARPRGLPLVTVDGTYDTATMKSAERVARALGALEATIAKPGTSVGEQRIIRWPASRTPAQYARAAGRRRAARRAVAAPVRPLISSEWGYHPSVHDGVDLVTEGDDVIYALCDGRVIDVRSSGWWGKGARASGGHVIADGDGIIQLECLTDVGPFRKGLHFGYGHAEKARVNVGQTVKAGDPIGHAGIANRSWHVHFMCNAGDTLRGIGDRDPMPFVLYAIAKGRR